MAEKKDGDLTPTECATRVATALKYDKRIRKIDAEILEHEATQEEAKGLAKAAREKREKYVAKLRACLNGTNAEQQELPFKSEPPKNDGWRKAKVEALQVSDSIRQKLIDAELFTIGDLADFGADERKHKGQGLCAIKGIGEGAEAKLQEALEFFWAQWAKRNDSPPDKSAK